MGNSDSVTLRRGAKIRILIYFSIVAGTVILTGLSSGDGLAKTVALACAVLTVLLLMLFVLLGVSSGGKMREVVWANLKVILWVAILLQAIIFFAKVF